MQWMLMYVPMGTQSANRTGLNPLGETGPKVNLSNILIIIYNLNIFIQIYKKIFDRIKSDFFFKKEGDRTCKLDIFENASTSSIVNN